MAKENVKQKGSIYDKMSDAELLVADFLTNFGIWWNYEQPVVIKDEDDKQRTWYPDFFLSELGIYVEVCGTERNEDYERRRKIYHKNHLSVIFVETFKGERKWKLYLLDTIIKIQAERTGLLLASAYDKVFNE